MIKLDWDMMKLDWGKSLSKIFFINNIFMCELITEINRFADYKIYYY